LRELVPWSMIGRPRQDERAAWISLPRRALEYTSSQRRVGLTHQLPL